MVSLIDFDRFFLEKALEQAELRRGFCAPNPSVGAVIVRDQGILAVGYHQGPGCAHAEIDALSKLSSHDVCGATIYVTLEPCCHFGRTPPCVDALIAAGIKRVVYGFVDPNPIVAGKGHQQLANVGIECLHVPLSAINDFYRSYQHWMHYKKPFITAKIALSLDGKIAGKSGEPLAITGNELRNFTHAQRKKSDAILTSVKTIIADDPQLNARCDQFSIAKSLYILDRQLQIPITAKVFSTAKSLTLFHASNASDDCRERLVDLGVRCIAVNEDEYGLCLTEIISIIGNDGLHDLWIEAGGICFSAFLQQQLLQRAYVYIAPVFVGNGVSAFADSQALDLTRSQVCWQSYGKDVLCQIDW